MQVTQPHCNRITVSGTASIEPGGKTVYLDGAPRQIDLTMRVVEAILEQRDMNWSNVVRAIGYFKDAWYYQDYVKYCNDHDIPDMPMIITENAVA